MHCHNCPISLLIIILNPGASNISITLSRRHVPTGKTVSLEYYLWLLESTWDHGIRLSWIMGPAVPNPKFHFSSSIKLSSFLEEHSRVMHSATCWPQCRTAAGSSWVVSANIFRTKPQCPAVCQHWHPCSPGMNRFSRTCPWTVLQTQLFVVPTWGQTCITVH